MAIEPDLVYPLARGRDISRWNARPSAHIILTQDPHTRKGIAETTMKRQYPKTFAYLKHFEQLLRQRSGFRQYFRPTDPFYSVYNVGPHTLAIYKVVWAGQVAFELDAAVVDVNDAGRPIVMDQTAYQVPFRSKEEARFFCGVLNSTPTRALYKVVAYKHTSMNFIQNVRIPQYDVMNFEHRSIAEHAALCQAAAISGNRDQQIRLEEAIDRFSATMWGLTEVELKAMRRVTGEE